MIAPAAGVPLVALAFAADRDDAASPPALGFSSRRGEGVSTLQHDNAAEGLADAHCNPCGYLDEEPIRAPHEQPMNVHERRHGAFYSWNLVGDSGNTPTRKQSASRTCEWRMSAVRVDVLLHVRVVSLFSTDIVIYFVD